MLNAFPIAVIAGIALGFLAGLGIGGGSLLIIWLTVVVGIDPQTARSINLLFFIPSAVIVCIHRHRDGTLKLRPLLPAMIAGCFIFIRPAAPSNGTSRPKDWWMAR